MEIELKYTIADRALIEEIFNDDQVRRYKDENTEVLIPMNAVFYDTPDYKLQRAGFAFRIRREGDENVATLKWGGTTSEGMHKRQELNITLDDEEARHPAISIFGQDEVGGELERLIGDEPLEALMEIQYLRRQVRLDTGKSISELSADEGFVRANGGETPICEMEIELYSGDEEDMRALGDEIASKYDLKLENTSKFKRGLSLLFNEKSI